MKRLPLFIASLALLLSGCDLAPSQVKVREQPADGLTESSFDQAYLEQLVEETRQAAEQSLQEAYARNGIPAEERSSHATATGRYEWFGQRQLAIIDLSYSANPMRVVRVVGINGDRLVTVSCISPQGAPVALEGEDSECGETIAEHFGPVR